MRRQRAPLHAVHEPVLAAEGRRRRGRCRRRIELIVLFVGFGAKEEEKEQEEQEEPIKGQEEAEEERLLIVVGGQTAETAAEQEEKVEEALEVVLQ